MIDLLTERVLAVLALWKHGPDRPIRSEAELLQAAYETSPRLPRWLGLGVPFALLDRRLDGHPEWEAWKADRRAGDKVWPFRFNAMTLAYREGYVLVRNGRPCKVLLTAVS